MIEKKNNVVVHILRPNYHGLIIKVLTSYRLKRKCSLIDRVWRHETGQRSVPSLFKYETFRYGLGKFGQTSRLINRNYPYLTITRFQGMNLKPYQLLLPLLIVDVGIHLPFSVFLNFVKLEPRLSPRASHTP